MKVQYEASGRLEESTERRGVDVREEQLCTKSITHLGCANGGTEGADGRRVRLAGDGRARPRARTRCHVCRKMSNKPEMKSSQSPAAEAAPPPRAVRGYGGPGLV